VSDPGQCPYSLLTELPAGESTVLKINSVYSIKARVLRENLGEFVSASNRTALECSLDTAWHFGEFGIYDLVVQPGKCTTDTYLEPVNIYLREFTTVTFLTNQNYSMQIQFCCRLLKNERENALLRSNFLKYPKLRSARKRVRKLRFLVNYVLLQYKP